MYYLRDVRGVARWLGRKNLFAGIWVKRVDWLAGHGWIALASSLAAMTSIT